MTVLVNAIYKDSASENKFRVLCTLPQEDKVVVISLSRKNTIPYFLGLSELEENITLDMVQKEENESLSILTDEINQKYIENMNNAWNVICDFVINEPHCYDPKARSMFIASSSLANNCYRMDVQRYLYKYWAGGKNKNALLPDYRNNGNCSRDKKSINSNEIMKRGRPSKYHTDNKGICITQTEKDNIKKIINKYYNKDNKCNMKFCYIKYLENYAMDKVEDSERKILKPQYITKRQFTYHAKSFINMRKRIGEKKFDRDLRGIVGSSQSEAMGPGDKFQLDATIGDIYLVSQLDRSVLVGRPVIYFISDVFSRMIAGFSVCLEGPSWASAMTAIYNMALNKVQVCKKYGIEINDEEWPCQGIPSCLMVDNGEMVKKASNSIVTGLGIHIENASAFRPDMKGIVENSFNLLAEYTKPLLPGSVYPDFKIRGGHDYRLDAKLTIDEFVKLIIYYILLNNSRLLTEDPHLDDDIIKDRVPAIPLSLWNWGIEHRSGILREEVDERIMIALMQKSKASITEKGILFKKLYYTCPRAIAEDWFSKARINGRRLVDIAFDPRNMNSICILFEDGKFEYSECTADSSRIFVGCNLEEIENCIENRRHDHKKCERTDLENTSRFSQRASEIVDIAEKMVKEQSKIIPLIGAKNLKGQEIRKNRKNEVLIEREKNNFMPPDDLQEYSYETRRSVESNDDLADYARLIRQHQLEQIEKSERKDYE